MTSFEQQRQIALAQSSILIDVLSAWRGHYEDDDKPAGIAWIMGVIPEVQASPERSGWLCVRDTATPGIGWRFHKGAFCLASLDRSLRGLPWPVTRRQFRAAARASGVSLPACHATLHLDRRDGSDLCPAGPVHDWHPFQNAWQWKCRRCEKTFRVEARAA